MKIWLTTHIGEKINKSFVYTPETYNDSQIAEYVKEICNELDEPTPIFLKKHYQHIKEFNNTQFTARDFVESIYFDSMNVQVYDENSKKKKDNPNYY